MIIRTIAAIIIIVIGGLAFIGIVTHMFQVKDKLHDDEMDRLRKMREGLTAYENPTKSKEIG